MSNHNGNDEVFLSHLFDLYESQTPGLINTLNQAVRKRDFKKLQNTCYQIKSSYGILEIEDLDRILDEAISFLGREMPEHDFALLSSRINDVIDIISAVNEQAKVRISITKK